MGGEGGSAGEGGDGDGRCAFTGQSSPPIGIKPNDSKHLALRGWNGEKVSDAVGKVLYISSSLMVEGVAHHALHAHQWGEALDIAGFLPVRIG